MQARREKNLCYNCDEQYTRGHHCKSQFLLLVSTEPDDDLDTPTDLDPRVIDDPSPKSGLINLHALSGQWAPRTLRLAGSINKYKSPCQHSISSGMKKNPVKPRVNTTKGNMADAGLILAEICFGIGKGMFWNQFEGRSNKKRHRALGIKDGGNHLICKETGTKREGGNYQQRKIQRQLQHPSKSSIPVLHPSVIMKMNHCFVMMTAC
ncbi:hypothetical protein V8G54_018706 [Vigna mungo]|uniref:Uncharacterized protein n=1 Tax=Vigna mungo TaxID=3915 RepID=A0AAQ3N984_VIGMU